MKKRVLKKSFQLLCLMLMLVFVALGFCGCAQVRVMTIRNDDGTIDEIVSITLKPEEIILAGYDVEQIKNDIMIKSRVSAESFNNDLNSKILNDLLRVANQESVDILNSFKNGIDVVKSDWEDNSYSIGIRFKNLDVYKYYYNIKENTKIETKREEHFFYDKVYYYANTMYVKHHALYDSVNNYYSSQYPELISTQEPELLYTYKTDLRRQRSDADFIVKQNGAYYHTWIVDRNNINQPIMLYYNIANSGNWILICFIITFVATSVIATIVVLKEYIKKKNKLIEKKDDEN